MTKQSNFSALYFLEPRADIKVQRASILESATRSKQGKESFHIIISIFDSGASRKWLETSTCDCLLPSFIVAAGILPSFTSFFPPLLHPASIVRFKYASFQSQKQELFKS